jgi:pyruvate carboxylase subunit B
MEMKFLIKINNKEYQIEAKKDGERINFIFNDEVYKAEVKESAPGLFSILFEDGTQREILANKISNNNYNFYINTKEYPIVILDNLSIEKEKFKKIEKKAEGWKIKAQIPGKIVRILKKEGEEVEKDEGVLIMEAMKMQNELKAPDKGKIKKIYVKEMEAVETGAILVEGGH